MKAGKVWGVTELLLKTPLIEVHRLTVLPNSHCSMHCHKFKHNAFYVTSGRIYIEVVKNDYQLVDVTEVGPGEFTTVVPNEFHRFVTKAEGMTGIEIYYLEPLSTDIVRRNVGGPNDVSDNTRKDEQQPIAWKVPRTDRQEDNT